MTGPGPTRAEIVTFDDHPLPPGASPWVDGAVPETGIAVVPSDDAWPERFEEVAALVRGALGRRVLALEHVGSTAVPGLWAKPIIDVDLTVADPADEASYLPDLLSRGFELRVREPWWHEHRGLRLLPPAGPHTNLHVFGLDSPETVRHRLFRDWLRDTPADRERYGEAKRGAAEAANRAGESVEEYNARKQRVLREIYQRMFEANGLV